MIYGIIDCKPLLRFTIYDGTNYGNCAKNPSRDAAQAPHDYHYSLVPVLVGVSAFYEVFMAGRIVRNRCVLLLGRTGSGKSAVANHLVGYDPLSPDEPPFYISDIPGETATKEVKHEVGEFVWENNLYRVTVVDTPGFHTQNGSSIYSSVLFNIIEKYIKQHVIRIDLILFVRMKSSYTEEDRRAFTQLFSFIRNRLRIRDFSSISALALTGCEADSYESRKEIVRRFCHSEHSRDIASQMGMGIYPVAFPSIQCLPEFFQDFQQQMVIKDRDTLRGLIVRVNAERERGEQHCNTQEIMSEISSF